MRPFLISPGDALGTTGMGQNIQILIFLLQNSPRKNENNILHHKIVDMFVCELVLRSISEQEVAVD